MNCIIWSDERVIINVHSAVIMVHSVWTSKWFQYLQTSQIQGPERASEAMDYFSEDDGPTEEMPL